MANSTLQEEVLRLKALQLQEDLDAMMANASTARDAGDPFEGIWDIPATPLKSQVISGAKVTGVMANDFVKESQEKRIAREEAEKRKWLDDTQNMRVVALNEACGVVKSMMENNDQIGVDPKMITAYARAFADFLVEGRS